MFEAVQFVELRGEPEPMETVLGEFGEELVAVESARAARVAFSATGSDDYAWWIVRKKGARLANFIADSKSDKEFVLDLSSGELIEVPS
jgi:uroporphyrinogen-III synthase